MSTFVCIIIANSLSAPRFSSFHLTVDLSPGEAEFLSGLLDGFFLSESLSLHESQNIGGRIELRRDLILLRGLTLEH